MCCDTKREKIVARNPLELLQKSWRATHASFGKNRGEKPVGAASCIARPSRRLAHNNFTKAQAAGL